MDSQLGQRIRVLREARSLKRSELAQRAGISVSFLSMVERAQRAPHVKTLLAISNALGLTLSQLFLGLNAPRTNIGRPRELPLMAHLGALDLNSDDVQVLLVIAKMMFKKRRSRRAALF